MIHSLKIYAIYSISINNIEIDYNEIPQDLHKFTKDFNKFFKLNRYSKDFIYDFDDLKDYIINDAIHENHLEVVKYLHENGADASMEGCTAPAVINGNLELFKYLVDNNITWVESGDSDGEFITHAVENGHLDIVKYLVENGIDIH